MGREESRNCHEVNLRGGGIPEKIVENHRVLHSRITSGPPGGLARRDGMQFTA